MQLQRTSHELHDQLLIAGDAAGDQSVSGHLAASRLLASCPDCAALHADLVALVAATRTLRRWQRRAPRSFAITAAQAARVGRGGWWRGLLEPFARPQGTTRPLAYAFTSLGLVGILLVALGPALLGGVAGSAGMARDMATGDAAATAAPAFAGGGSSNGGSSNGGTGATEGGGTPAKGGEASSPLGGDTNLPGPTSVDQAPFAPGPAGWFAIVSGVMVAAGLALFGLRALARRLT